MPLLEFWRKTRIRLPSNWRVRGSTYAWPDASCDSFDGKAGFCHLQQDGKRLQIYVKKDAVGDKGFELYKLLDLGDHIGVSGYLFRTRTGELTVHVEEITFLSKDLLPLPEKFHGLTDVELRYRQRYVDLVVNPEVRKFF